MSKLFDKKLGVASDQETLTKLKKKFKSFDPIYVAVSTMTTQHDFRDWLELVWKQYKPYADTNFSNEFKIQFNQRAWELHLGSTLLNRGYILEKHNKIGPDFKIPHEGKNVYIEAIAVEKGVSNDKVPKVKNKVLMDVPEKEMLLRLTAGVKEKHTKYLSYLINGVIQQNDPFVIAIDRSPLEHVDPQIPLIFKCLFAIGYQVLFLRGNKSKTQTEESTWSVRDKINKINNSEVEMSIFRNPCFEGISAIIYCNQNIFNSPKDPKHMGDSFVIVHNPFAKNPLPYNFFTFGSTWVQEGVQVKKI